MYSQIQTIRATIHLFLRQCNVPYKVIPFDHDLYQECIDEAIRRGYVVEGDHSVRMCLRVGIDYAATAGGHLTRPTQLWVALYTACLIYVDEIPVHFPSEIPKIYLFNNWFLGRQPQENVTLDALVDLICRAPDLFRPIPSRLITTTSLNFFTANLLEDETASMQVLPLFSLRTCNWCEWLGHQRSPTVFHLPAYDDWHLRRFCIHGIPAWDPADRVCSSNPRGHTIPQRYKVCPLLWNTSAN